MRSGFIAGLTASMLAAGLVAPAAANADGGGWASYGPTFNGPVYSLIQSGNTFYAGGKFFEAGGSPTYRFLAKFDAGTTTALPASTSVIAQGNPGDGVYGLALDGTTLYAGGLFAAASGPVTLNNIATVNVSGSNALTALGSGTYNAITAFAAVDQIAVDSSHYAYVVGGFTGVGNSAANDLNVQHVAKWNGTTWSALTNGASVGANDWVNGVAVNGSTVYIGGQFTSPKRAFAFTADSGTNWSGATAFTGGGVYEIVAPATNNVFIGGRYTNINGTAVAGIAKFDGTNYWALGSGIAHSTAPYVEALTWDSTNNVLYVGGNFTTAGGVTVNNIAKWDPATSTWSALGCGSSVGVNGVVRSILPQSDGSIVVGGLFTSAGGNAAPYVAKFTPSSCPSSDTGGGGSSSVAAETPSAPLNVTAAESPAGMTVTWNAPASSGTSPITNYAVTSTDGSLNCSTPSLVCTFDRTKLVKGRSYTFEVKALNAVGWGSAGTSSAAQFADTPPSAPTNVVLTPISNGMHVQWTPPSSAGSTPITGYRVTTTAGSATCDAPARAISCTLSGITAGKAATYTVTSSNSSGASAGATSASSKAFSIDITQALRSRDDARIRIDGHTKGLSTGTKLQMQVRAAKGASWEAWSYFTQELPKTAADGSFTNLRTLPDRFVGKTIQVRMFLQTSPWPSLQYSDTVRLRARTS